MVFELTWAKARRLVGMAKSETSARCVADTAASYGVIVWFGEPSHRAWKSSEQRISGGSETCTYDIEQEQLAHVEEEVHHSICHVTVHNARMDIVMLHDTRVTTRFTVELRQPAGDQVNLVLGAFIGVIRVHELPIVVVIPARLGLERTHPDHTRRPVIFLRVGLEHWGEVSVLEK